MKYSVVIFDFDGVIVDSWLGISKGFVKCLKEYGINETIENVKKMIGPPFAHLIVDKYGFTKEEGAKAIMIHRKYVKEKGVYEANLYEGVYQMLKTLYDKGVTLAIASNKPIDNVIYQAKYFKIDKFFSFINGQDDLQTRGEKSDLVRESLEFLKAKKHDKVLMIGDKPTDIIGGHENGADSVMVGYGYGSKEEIKNTKAEYIIKNPLDLLSIIFGDEYDKTNCS